MIVRGAAFEAGVPAEGVDGGRETAAPDLQRSPTRRDPSMVNHSKLAPQDEVSQVRQGQGCLRYVKRGREKADRGEEQSRAYTV